MPSVVLQIVLVLFGAITLDGGQLLRIFGVSALAYWLAVAFIYRRTSSPRSKLDSLIVKWGYLPAVGVASLSAMVIWPR